MPTGTFYWRHLRFPLVAFVLLAAVLATTPLDITIAHALFFDEAQSRWIGADQLVGQRADPSRRHVVHAHRGVAGVGAMGGDLAAPATARTA